MDEEVEEAFARLSWALYRLREQGKHQEAYDATENIIAILQEDREYQRKTGKVQW